MPKITKTSQLALSLMNLSSRPRQAARSKRTAVECNANVRTFLVPLEEKKRTRHRNHPVRANTVALTLRAVDDRPGREEAQPAVRANARTDIGLAATRGLLWRGTSCHRVRPRAG